MEGRAYTSKESSELSWEKNSPRQCIKHWGGGRRA